MRRGIQMKSRYVQLILTVGIFVGCCATNAMEKPTGDSADELVEKAKLFRDAVDSGSVERVRTMVNADVRLLEIRDTTGNSWMHIAALRGHVSLIEFFGGLALRLVTAIDSYGNTPLHIAAFWDVWIWLLHWLQRGLM